MTSTKTDIYLLKCFDKEQQNATSKNEVSRRVADICKKLKKQGVHSASAISAAGLTYTGVGDTARCDTCGLEVSQWTVDMNPFTIHIQRSCDCSFIKSILLKNQINFSSSNGLTINKQNYELSDHDENSPKRRKIDNKMPNLLAEVNMMKEIRCRTFSHWPQHVGSLKSQMISAGFFYCNLSDRVICLYCNLICQQWTSHTDDPQEVHQTLSPRCPYVLFILNTPKRLTATMLNETADLSQFRGVVQTSACHSAYAEIPKRQASFNSWPQEQLPSVDDLVQAGFFYTSSKNIVTCFYCNGSLQNWGLKDNPLIEHVRWFPSCAYAKQLCGDELYRKIQKSKQIAQERNTKNRSEKSGDFPHDSRLVITDENTLSRFVAARLDLPISQHLLNQNFKLSIIKRSWEDQLRLKQNDFPTDCDLWIACVILQKQIDHINGKKENIVVPSIAMKNIHEKPQIDSSTSNQPNTNKISETKSTTVTTDNQSEGKENSNSTKQSSSSNICVLCCIEEKRLACIPCGHLATCVPCSHSLRTCPICRREIEAFVRIYI